MNASDRLAEGLRLLNAGQLAQAEVVLRALLQQQPGQAEALHLLGLTVARAGRLADGIDFISQAIAAGGEQPVFLSNLGMFLQSAGRIDEAATCFEKAVARDPKLPDALLGMGNIAAIHKDHPRARHWFERSLAEKPDFPEAWGNLARVRLELDQVSEAIEAGKRALTLKPFMPNVLFTLGQAYRALDRYEEAAAAYQTILNFDPNFVLAHVLRVGIFLAQQRLADADAEIALALAKAPNAPAPHFAKAQRLLKAGQYEAGFAEYEWRRRLEAWKAPEYPMPAWDSSPLAGRSVLIHLEQGLGDTFHFLRFVPRLRPAAGRIILRCQPRLVPLLADHPAFDRVYGPQAPINEGDVWAPILSLPHLLKLSPADYTGDKPYLNVKADLVEKWRQRLSAWPGRRVALAWKGSKLNPHDRHRSFALSAFAPLAGVRDVTFFSVQPDETTAGAPMPIVAFENDFDAAPFLDTAAVLKNVDLLIACDSATAHLAGALGVPAWLALDSDCDWRWGFHGETTHWYPRHRLFRQPKAGDWESVFTAMAAEL